MTGQQWTVVADRDKGDDMEAAVETLEDGDRVTYIYDTDPPDRVVRIERPVPTTDERPDDSEINKSVKDSEDIGEALAAIASKYDAAVTNNEPRWQDGIYLRHLGEFMRDVLDAVHRHQHAPHPPTREQIAEAIAKAEDADYWVDEVRQWEALEQWERDAQPQEYPGMAYEDRESFLRTADAIALIQNGADR